MAIGSGLHGNWLCKANLPVSIKAVIWVSSGLPTIQELLRIGALTLKCIRHQSNSEGRDRVD